MAYNTLEVREEEDCAVLLLDRPEKMNALTHTMLDEIRSALEEFERNDKRPLVLAGKGDAFCAGMDLDELKEMEEEDAERLSKTADEMTTMLELSEQVTVAAVDGHCHGGGFEIALACDVRVATPDTVFSQPEVGLGLTPGFGGTVRLPRMVGLAHAKRIILQGEELDGEEASDLGLVDDIVDSDDCLEEAIETAVDLAERTAPTAYQEAKGMLSNSLELPKMQAIERERDKFADIIETEDAQGGIEAFLDDRDAEFTGD